MGSYQRGSRSSFLSTITTKGISRHTSIAWRVDKLLKKKQKFYLALVHTTQPTYTWHQGCGSLSENRKQKQRKRKIFVEAKAGSSKRVPASTLAIHIEHQNLNVVQLKKYTTKRECMIDHHLQRSIFKACSLLRSWESHTPINSKHEPCTVANQPSFKIINVQNFSLLVLKFEDFLKNTFKWGFTHFSGTYRICSSKVAFFAPKDYPKNQVRLIHEYMKCIVCGTKFSEVFPCNHLSYWDFAWAHSTFVFVREFWQMRIDLLITSKRLNLESWNLDSTREFMKASCVPFWRILGHVIMNWHTRKRRFLARKFVNSPITQKPLCV